MATPNENLVHARFFMHTAPNEVKSKEAGRPIFDEYEAVEIRFAANKQTVHVAPAHEIYRTKRNFSTGEATPVTYAMDFNEQYLKFKEGVAQDGSGTPLSELPFLTQGKRLELKSLNIHTAEALAALDGTPLKRLGMGGRELKNQAQAYLDNAAGSVDVVKLAAQNAALMARIEALEGKPAAAIEDETSTETTVSPFAAWEADDLKNWIAEQTGKRPAGNPSHATLVKQADAINADLAKKAERAA